MRKSGILMHISSLPSRYGIGTFGDAAYKFVDFLVGAGQSYWQILPLNPTSYGDSPYQSPSAFAGNPYFIDLDILCGDGLLTQSEIDHYFFGNSPVSVDYGCIFESRYPLLRTAFSRFEKNSEYYEFVNKNSFWLDGYAMYMAIKEDNHYTAWTHWSDDIRKCNIEAIESLKAKSASIIEFYKFIQYLFFKQWSSLKKYANEKGIKIIGDMPIYVALDSADTWEHREIFEFNSEGFPNKVAGCPPDAFSPTGQLWGNPIYNWDKMRENGYEWWINRIKFSTDIYDRIRIDHFRGFESYYEIDYGSNTAERGKWVKGPGMDLFNAVRDSLGDIDIIAEDLGFLTPEVYELVKESGYPGMKVLQFAFNPYDDSSYLPHNFINNCVAYTGTHDNDTVLGWCKSANTDEVEYAGKYLGINHPEEYPKAFIRAVMSSVADAVIIPIQDFLGLDSSARMNTPSKSGGNWSFRVTEDMLSYEVAKEIYDITNTYRRLGKY